MAKVKIQGHASGTGVLTVTAPNTSTDRTITLPDSTDTLIGAATTDALTTRINATGGRKNIIINGAMQVAQRGTSSTVSGYGSVDRWRSVNNVGITHTQEAITSGDPFDAGFRHSCKLTNTAIVDNAAAHYVSFYQYIEAQDLAKSGWNYKSASSYITISFWVKSSVAGTYNVNPQTQDTTQKVYPQTFSLSADTWTKVEKSFPGHSSITFNNDNDRGMALHISPFYGTDFTDSGVSTSAWSDYGSATRFPDYAQRWGSAGTGATFEVTGVQVELGSVATNFEHISYGEELARCERYCQLVVQGVEAIGIGMAYSTGSVNCIVDLTCEMRTTPTITQTSGTNYYSIEANGGRDNIDDFSSGFHSRTWKRRLVLHAQTGVSQVAGHASQCEGYDANALITAEAEL